MSGQELSMATLMGGTEVEVRLQDGSSEVVKVLQLQIEQYPRLLSLLDDERAQVELYCGRPAGWAAKLAVASHHRIMAVAEELNGDFFGAWLRRKMGKLELLKPGLADDLLRGLISPGGAPKPRSSAG